MNRTIHFVDNVVDAVLAIIVAGTVVILTAGVWYRYVLNSSLGWTDEVGSYLLVWITFLGGYPCFRKGLHLDFPMVVGILNPTVQRWLARAVAAVLAIFCAFVAWQSWKVTSTIGHARISSLDIPRGLFLAAMPVSFALMSLALALDVLRGKESGASS